MNESTKRRIRRTGDEWRRLIDEQADSGLTQSTFCQANGLRLSSFQNWKHRLAAEVPTEPWVELGMLDRPAGMGWDNELELGEGICLRLRRC
jgi:hypothetical protein